LPPLTPTSFLSSIAIYLIIGLIIYPFLHLQFFLHGDRRFLFGGRTRRKFDTTILEKTEAGCGHPRVPVNVQHISGPQLFGLLGILHSGFFITSWGCHLDGSIVFYFQEQGSGCSNTMLDSKGIIQFESILYETL
jgi:hypothetical protein